MACRVVNAGCAKGVATLVLSLLILIGAWYAALAIFNLNSYFAKTPADVFHFLITADAASQNRAVIDASLRTTLRDAGIGYVAGTAIGVVAASTIILSTAAEISLMPLLVALQTVPLVAMTPIIALAFGRGLLAVAVVGAIVTFFPTVVYLVRRMRLIPISAVDVIVAAGGGRRHVLVKLQLPNAIPAIFAAARVAVPSSIVAAMLAEWLVTGQGIGYLILSASSSSDFDTMWSAVVVITVVSVAVYTAVAAVEAAVLRRFDMS